MSKKFRTIVPLLLAVALFGCSKGLEKNTMSAGSFLELTPSPATPDITPPTVSTYSPTGTGIGLTTTISVIFSEDMLQSTISSSTFQVTTGVTPVPGRVTYNFLTKMYTFTPDNILAYNTDYTVTISGSVTDKAGNALGADHAWTFTTQDATRLPTPGFTPISGSYDSNNVSITYSGPTANIYFTTNNTDPSPTNGILYDGNPISINENIQIRAIACENPGYYDSIIAVGDFYFHTGQPTLSYAGGTYHNDISVELFPPSSDPSATIYYEMTVGTTMAPPADPAIPTTASTLYTGPIDVTGDFTVVKITMIAVISTKCDSIPLTVTYTIDYYQTGTPTFSPGSGTYDLPQSVTISHDPGSTVYYTTDGTDPALFGVPYDDGPPAVPIDVLESTTFPIRAIATMGGYRDSVEATASYIINPAIDYINPGAASNSETNLSALIRGARFDPAATVSLTDGVTNISPLTTSWVDPTALQCTFDLTGATTGYWSLTVTNPDTGTTTLVDGFRIYANPAGTVSWWKLNGDALDSVGPNEGSPSGSITYTTDRFGTASSAAANSTMTSSIQAAAVGLPVGSSPRTMVGWFKVDAFNAVDSFLFGYGSGVKFCKLYVNNIGNRLVFNDDGDIITGNTVLQAGRWYHVAVTYNGTVATLYLDGMIEGSASVSLSTGVSGTMYMFKIASLLGYLNGALDDVMVLNTALTQAGVQEVAANGGYLLPPVNLQASKSFVNQIVLTWDPVLDAADYDVYRETSLAGAFATPLNVAPITVATYTDTAIAPSTLYYYKVRAKNAARTSAQTKAEVGYTYGTLTTLTEGFEWVFASWWDIAPTQPVVTGSTGASFGTTPAQYDGNSQMTVASSTLCTGGCGFTESLALTKSFITPISYFTLSLYYIYTPGADPGGNFSVYVNNVDPSDDPANGLAPFAQELRTGGWWQRSLFYMGNNDINSITIIFYDITDTAEFNVDLLKLNYK